MPGTQSPPARIRVVLQAAQGMADVMPGVVAVGLAGSWARGRGRPDSDVDLMVLTTAAEAALTSTDWFGVFGSEAELVRSADLGAIQERRLRLGDGLVVEVGIAEPAWAGTDPVDPGTRRVVEDGFAAVHDPHGVLARLMSRVKS